MRFSAVIRLHRPVWIAGLMILVLSVCVVCSGIRDTWAVSVPVENGKAVPILMYHSLLKDPARAGQYVISPDQFRQDIQYLQEHGYTTVLMTDVIRYVQEGTPLPEKPIVITFDDGYYNNYLYGFPILKELNAKAVISIIGRYTDLFSQTDENNAYYSHCTWDQIREMQASGLVEIQNHTYNLHTYDNRRHGCANKKWEVEADYDQTVGEDILKLQNRIRTETQFTPNTFVYPFGSYTKMSEALIRDLGFSASLSCESGVTVVYDAESLYCMKRYIRPSGSDSVSYFQKIGL